MKILLTTDDEGFQEFIGPFSGNIEADEWARKELPYSTAYEIHDITVPKGIAPPETISIDLDALKSLDLSPLLGKEL